MNTRSEMAIDVPDEPGSLPYDEIARDLTIRHIATPVDDLVAFDISESAGRAVAMLRRKGIDFAPVLDGDTYVGRLDITTPVPDELVVGDVLDPLTARYLVSANSPISQAIRWLMNEPWLLVVEGRDVIGVVSPADLNRQATRVYFYMLIADWEIRLADLLRDHYQEQGSALGKLPPKAAESVRRRHEDLRKRDVDVDLIGAMDLSHFVRLVQKTPPALLAAGFTQPREWKKLTGGIVGFRHQIMHPTRPLLASIDDLERLADLDARLHRLLAALS